MPMPALLLLLLRHAATCLLVALGTAAVGAETMAASDKQAHAKTAPKKSRALKVQHQQNNSQESTAERDRRLHRECRGLPNAGACRGYTQR